MTFQYPFIESSKLLEIVFTSLCLLKVAVYCDLRCEASGKPRNLFKIKKKAGKRRHWEFHFKPFASWIWITKAPSKESTCLLCEFLRCKPRPIPQPPSTCKIASINSHNYLFSFMRICSAVAAAFLRRKHNKVTKFKVALGRALYLHSTDNDDVVTADMWREPLKAFSLSGSFQRALWDR